jgi:hypothetical protein
MSLIDTKWICTEIKMPTVEGTVDLRAIVFRPHPTDPDNGEVWLDKPTGKCELLGITDAKADQFEIGSVYKIEISADA